MSKVRARQSEIGLVRASVRSLVAMLKTVRKQQAHRDRKRREEGDTERDMRGIEREQREAHPDGEQTSYGTPAPCLRLPCN